MINMIKYKNKVQLLPLKIQIQMQHYSGVLLFNLN